MTQGMRDAVLSARCEKARYDEQKKAVALAAVWTAITETEERE